MKNDYRFLDEAGDTTFYGKGKINILGQEGVSKCFILGLVHFKEPLEPIREKIKELQDKVIKDDYFKGVPSIQKKAVKEGFFFHATDDIPEVRKIFFEFIKTIDCTFEAVVGRKIIGLYISKHNGKENEFYADLLAHLLKNKFQKERKMIINVAERGKSTRNTNLDFALKKAEGRFLKNTNGKTAKAEIAFNVQNHITEPLLNIADYFCWAVQRVFEKGETRYYDYIVEKIPVVIDLYDKENYKEWKNYYGPKNPLSSKNKLSPPLH
ncbi:MAG: DUF3800 domain-containing protein [Spirochaetota bacterium]